MNEIKFSENKAMTPLEQLLIILPAQSKYLLPKSFERLVSNPESSLSHLYPVDFQIDFYINIDIGKEFHSYHL